MKADMNRKVTTFWTEMPIDAAPAHACVLLDKKVLRSV